jgi:hypothetical protein
MDAAPASSGRRKPRPPSVHLYRLDQPSLEGRDIAHLHDATACSDVERGLPDFARTIHPSIGAKVDDERRDGRRPHVVSPYPLRPCAR